MRGNYCTRLLWYTLKQPEVFPEMDAAQQFRFDVGREVGELAKRFYPSGVEIEWRSMDNAIGDTQTAIKARKPIFEATFLYDTPFGKLLSRADLLVPVGNQSWDMIEVKSSNSLKDEHIEDVGVPKNSR